MLFKNVEQGDISLVTLSEGSNGFSKKLLNSHVRPNCLGFRHITSLFLMLTRLCNYST